MLLLQPICSSNNILAYILIAFIKERVNFTPVNIKKKEGRL